MQVSASEGLANHTVPESCAETREGFGEALTGVRIGWVLSRENNTLGVEGNMARRASASAWTARRGRRPQHVRKLLARYREISPLARINTLARIGKVMS